MLVNLPYINSFAYNNYTRKTSEKHANMVNEMYDQVQCQMSVANKAEK